MSIFFKALEKAFNYVDQMTDKLVDYVISKPESSKTNEEVQSAVTVGASALTTRAITIGAISATEGLSAIGAGTLAQGTATVAAAGTELLAAPATAAGTLVASESMPLIAAGGAVLAFSLVGGKIVSRGVGHAYDYFTGGDREPALPQEDVVVKNTRIAPAI